MSTCVSPAEKDDLSRPLAASIQIGSGAKKPAEKSSFGVLFGVAIIAISLLLKITFSSRCNGPILHTKEEYTS